MHDRHEDALAALRQFRQGKFTEEEIKLEFATIQIPAMRSEKKAGFFDQFKSQNIRRTIIVIFINFFLQATGNIWITIYGTVYVKSLNTVNTFTFSVVTSVISLTTGILAMVLMEKVGRRYVDPERIYTKLTNWYRRLLMIGACVQCIGLFTMAGLGLRKPQTYGSKTGIAAMMAIFAFGFSLGFAPISHTLSVEIPSNALRDISYRTCSVVNVTMQ